MYDLIKIEDIAAMSTGEVTDYYLKHVNVGVPKFLNMLGLDMLEPQYAEGINIFTRCGRKIYDFTGGISVLNLGHNHPRILKARRIFADSKRMEVWKAFMSPYLAALSKNIAEISPGDLNYSFFCNSGAEANEGALKIAEKYQGRQRTILSWSLPGLWLRRSTRRRAVFSGLISSPRFLYPRKI